MRIVDRLRRIDNYKKVIIIFFIGLLIYNLLIPKPVGDDTKMFLRAISGGEFKNRLFPYLAYRYNNWSSRVVIEMWITFAVQHFVLWKILNSFVMIGLVYILNVYFNKKRSINVLLITIVSVIAMPNRFVFEPGWVADTGNYLWPITFALFAFFPFYQKLTKQKINPYSYVLSLLALIFASNQEQVGICVFALMILIIGYLVVNGEKVWILMPSWIINICLLLVTVLSPGNKVRYNIELHRFPEYGQIGLLKKLEVGFSSSGSELFLNFNIIVWLLFVVMVLLARYKIKDRMLKMITYMPFITSSIFYVFSMHRDSHGWTDNIVNNFFIQFTSLGTKLSISNTITWAPDFLILILIISLVVGLWNLIDDKRKAIFAIVISAMGFLSKFVMAFSPTVWASGIRVDMILYFSVVIVLLMLLKEYETDNKKGLDLIVNFMVPAGIIINIIYITAMPW